MKLQTQTNIYNIIYSGIILIITGYFLQHSLIKNFYKQIDDGIITERKIIEDEIEHLNTIPDYSSIFGHQIEVVLSLKPVSIKSTFKNVEIFNKKTQTNLLYREHFFARNRKHGLDYTIRILKPIGQLPKFKRVIILVISLTFILLLIIFMGTGYYVNRSIWRPFFQTLESLNQFNLEAPVILNFESTSIKEFQQLNENISSFSYMLKRDFIRMKEFSENLSHEINTMLAIIISKIELIIQKEDLTKEQINHFQTIYQVTNNLSHLNHGLLLLAKIDNKYYSSLEQINIELVINEHLQTFDDFIRQKKLKVKTRLTSTYLNINRSLASILISNLLIDAVRHNAFNGFLNIYLTHDYLEIQNAVMKAKNENFDVSLDTKNKAVALKSFGLGLEIIKRICRTYNFSLNYTQKDLEYSLKIGFEGKVTSSA